MAKLVAENGTGGSVKRDKKPRVKRYTEREIEAIRTKLQAQQCDEPLVSVV